MAGISDGTVSVFRIGSFNVGACQEMLTGKKTKRYVHKVESIITTCVQEGCLHIMNMCELGGHLQGFNAVGINPRDMKIFQGTAKTAAPSVCIDSNYLTAWGFDADTPQYDVRAACPSKTYLLNSSVCEPQLVVHSFRNGAGVPLMLGNLHIRTPQGETVVIKLRQRLVREALQKLESDAPSDSATQPVVLVLVGDCNLVRETAEEAIQPMQPEEPNWRTVWQVHTTTAARGGDLIFVKGAYARSFDLPFGISHRDRGIRNDTHDAIAIDLRVGGRQTEPEPTPKGNPTRSDQSESSDPRETVLAPVGLPLTCVQPARDDDDACHTDDAPQLARPSNVVPKSVNDPKETVHAPVGLPLTCVQPARDDDDACHTDDVPTPVNSLTNHVGDIVENRIREFWANRGEEGEAVQKEVKHLRTLLFRRQKHPVSQDIWIPGGSHPGEKLHVEAVVSETFVLKQIKDVIELRETWLRQNNLPMTCQMRDMIERPKFLAWAKDQYHAQEFQQIRQQEDLKHGGKAKVRSGKNSRWSRDLQRRLGTPALWHMVRATR